MAKEVKHGRKPPASRPRVTWRWNARALWRAGMSVCRARATAWADDARIVLRAERLAYEPPAPANEVFGWWRS